MRIFCKEKPKKMYKSMNFSADTAVPSLSGRNVDLIAAEIGRKPSMIVEYGSGGSTLFFIKQLVGTYKVKFVSIENTSEWFCRVAKELQKLLGGGKVVKNYWPLSKYKSFLQGGFAPFTRIIDGYSRYASWAAIMKAGPFWRFEPASNSRFALNKNANVVMRPIFGQLTNLFRRLGLFRHYDACLNISENNVDLHYLLLSPGIKDQFGESPFRDDYADAWQAYLTPEVTSVLFMIDGGPRHYIVDRIHSFQKNNPHIEVVIALFDAHRPEYEPILDQFDAGCFYKGSMTLCNGAQFYDHEPAKELWLVRLGGPKFEGKMSP